MRTNDLINETYTSLSSNRVRSFLTILGIVIGISSVIALVAIGNGAQASINASIQSIGSNLLIVMPGAQRGPGFGVSIGRGTAQSITNDDATALQSQVANVQEVAGEVSGRYQAVAGGSNTNTTVDGVTPTYADVRNVQVSEGTFITDNQNNSLARVAVIGPTAAADLFPDGSDPVGESISIKNIAFTIVGETVAKGGSGFSNPDDIIFIPERTAQQYLSGNQYLSTIDVQATSADTMTQVQNDITNLLLQRHNISNPQNADFSVVNQADILATANSITSTFTLLLGAVAGISLLVGGIGIMNMMLTTVTERTREIGLRKAIGATRKEISMQFLAEAVALTLVGGAIGIVLGCAIAWGVTLSGLIKTSITLTSILLAFGVSAAIGIVFGYYPARKASEMSPIEALRYE